ncbi:MAG: FAD-dependent thymidylate synthase [Aristaeellaceae bacterium]
MPRSEMKVALIRHTLSPEEVVALGARLCYSKARVDDLLERVEARDQTAFVHKIMGMGHDSVLEHASFTFGIEGVSRVLLAQITRHRLASFSVQSQRYVSYEQGFGYIVPPKIEALGPEAVAEYERQMDTLHRWYTDWQQKLGTGEGGNEDARFVLPGACETRMMVTMNVRELRHFFSLRMCSRAQWEIRALATEMHRLCMEVAPALFADAGPGCLRGACPEGEKTCGRMVEIRAQRKAWLDTLSNNDEQ